MSILNPTPQEIEDDKIRTYRDYWNTTKAEEQPAKTKLDDIVEKHMAEAMSTVKQNQIEAEKYSTNRHSGKIFIVAGNRAEYTAWVERNGYKYTETQYVQNANSLRGIENIKGFYIGTYASRHDIQDIMSVIATSKRRTWADATTVATGFNPRTGMLDVDDTIQPTRPAEYLTIDDLISKDGNGTWNGTTTYIGGSGAGGTMSSSVGSIAAISYQQMRAMIRIEIREKLHDAIEELCYGDATRDVILAAIDKELDKY